MHVPGCKQNPNIPPRGNFNKEALGQHTRGEASPCAATSQSRFWVTFPSAFLVPVPILPSQPYYVHFALPRPDTCLVPPSSAGADARRARQPRPGPGSPDHPSIPPIKPDYSPFPRLASAPPQLDPKILTERPLRSSMSPSPTQGPEWQPTLAPGAQLHPEPAACLSAPSLQTPQNGPLSPPRPAGLHTAPRKLGRSRPQALRRAIPASSRPAATALPRFKRALRSPGRPPGQARAAPGAVERPPLQSGSAGRCTYPPPPRRSRSWREPGEGREQPGGPGSQRANPRGGAQGGGRFLVALLRAGA